MSAILCNRLVLALTALACSVTASGAPWRLIVVGDSRGSNNGVNTAILSEIAAQIVAEQPDLLIFPGDLVDGATNLTSQLTTWVSTMQPVYNAGIRVLAVRGNHENQGSVTSWNTVFTGAYAMPGNGPAGEVNCTYSLTHKNAFLVGLDVYFSHPHQVNQTWLNTQLAENTQPHVFVFTHEPAFKAYHTDCLGSYPAARDVFWQSITAARGRAYFCGHDHFYGHARVDDGDLDPNDDVHQLIVATGGAPLYVFNGVYNGANDNYTPIEQFYESNYGYVVVDIDGLNITLTWKHRTGVGTYAIAESWGYAAHPALGDLNCDGVINNQDIDGFILALFDPAGYAIQYPSCSILAGDFTGDGLVNNQDIDGFVAALFGG